MPSTSQRGRGRPPVGPAASCPTTPLLGHDVDTPERRVRLSRVGEDAELARGRAAAGRLAWADAHAALSRADRSEPLAAEDLERLATAAFLVGRIEDTVAALQRAQQAHARAGDDRRAARAAYWLGSLLIDRGELAQGSGWLARAGRLLEREPPDCPERGLLLTSAAYERLEAGDDAEALALAEQAAEIGRRSGDADLVALALFLQGAATVAGARVAEGMALIDEAMVAVVAGEVAPQLSGTIYCGVIAVCHEVAELRRAQEWTEALTAWCGRQPDMVAFTGKCLVHRAEILRLRGAWPEAVEEARLAGERLANSAAPDLWAAGDAAYQQGEGYRFLGRFEAAEDAYRLAGRRGREPQPGLALLRLTQGRTDSAQATIRRVLGETTDRLARSRLLPAAVEILLAAGDVPAAREGAAELAATAEAYGTVALRADAGHAAGAVLLAEGDAGDAVVALRGAWRAWRELEAPYEAARVRLLLGLACRALGDEDAAAIELDAARAVFAQLGAAPDLARLDTLARPDPAAAAGGLTERELQVLRLVAAGKTNHAIATHLDLAEKTVHRHVSNIYTKLGVSSRAAATAYAYQHHLL
jgi:DNA-binding CsgD family transcriptional regulator